MKKALKRRSSLDKVVAVGLRSNPAAMKEPGNAARREVGRWVNNRVENPRCHFGDESGRCSALDEGRRYKIRFGSCQRP